MDQPTAPTWPLAQAKAKLSEVIRAARRTPQIIASDGAPAAVVVAVEEYEELMSLRRALILHRRRETMERLREINAHETQGDFELPERGERPEVKLERDE